MSDIRLDGLVSGMDTESIITKLMQLEQGPVNAMKAQQQKLQAKSDAWRTINSQLYTFQSKAAALKSKDTFLAKGFESTDTTVLSGSATSSATAGLYTIKIDNLAQYHAVNSRAFSSSTESLGIGGAGTEVTIAGAQVTVAATDSLTTIAAKINGNSNAKANAAVVQVGPSNYRLIVTSKTSGLAGAMTITDNATTKVLDTAGLGLFTDAEETTLNSNDAQQARDASFSINGVAMTRGSNSFSDALPGVTLSLKNTGTVAVTVSDDADAIVKAVQDFVDGYNGLIDQINSQKSYDSENKTSGVLFGDSTLLRIESDIRRSITSAVPGLPSSLNTLSQIGVSVGGANATIEDVKSGKLTLDETTLRDKLSEDSMGVARLFGAVPVNLASVASGATVTASSELPGYEASGVINGDHASDRWGTPGGGWSDASVGTGDVPKLADSDEFDPDNPGTSADVLTINFPTAKTVDTVNIWTLNSQDFPSGTYGIRDYSIQYQYQDTDGSLKWKNAVTVKNNVLSYTSNSFVPVQTKAIRIAVTKSNGSDDHARILEVEALQYNQGVASSLYSTLFGYTRTAGLISDTTKSLDSEAAGLSDQIQAAEDRLTQREDSIRREFTAMETALSKLKSQGSYLSSQLSALQ